MLVFFLISFPLRWQMPPIPVFTPTSCASGSRTDIVDSDTKNYSPFVAGLRTTWLLPLMLASELGSNLDKWQLKIQAEQMCLSARFWLITGGNSPMTSSRLCADRISVRFCAHIESITDAVMHFPQVGSTSPEGRLVDHMVTSYDIPVQAEAITVMLQSCSMRYATGVLKMFRSFLQDLTYVFPTMTS